MTETIVAPAASPAGESIVVGTPPWATETPAAIAALGTPTAAPVTPELEELGSSGPSALPGVKFEFDAAFQSRIAALCCRDTVFVQRIDGLIKPDYFENGIEAAWVSVALRYFAKYRKVPTEPAVYRRLIEEDVKARIIDMPFAGLMARHWKAVLLGVDLTDRDFFADKVATFARHQAVSAAIIESVTLVERHDFEKVSAMLRKALDTGANTDGDTYDYGEMIAARTGERLDKAAGKLPPQGITTGYKTLDECLYHKGWGRRELALLLGGAKAGKTTALIDFGIQALKAHYNVLYVTLEVAAKIVAERMDANITETPVMDLDGHIHSVRDKVQHFVTESKAKFIVKEFPTGSMRVSDLRRLIERYKSIGTKFDLVIVDYADLVAPERLTENSIENSKSVYVNLRGLAMEQDIAILSATQTNRDGFKAAVAKAEHVADDFNKIRIADVVISINRTEEERAAGTARLYFAASRNQAGGFSIRVEQKLDCMKFISRVVGVE